MADSEGEHSTKRQRTAMDGAGIQSAFSRKRRI